jgi:8-oxo-dGTP diphosphatase
MQPEVALTTMVMIQNSSDEVLVQNRIKAWPGWSFPGGKVEPKESFYDCAVREIKEETGLNVRNLKYCGVIHWAQETTNDRYLVFCYKTSDYDGELLTDTPEGRHFWINRDELFATPEEKFSNEYVRMFPLFFEDRYSEAFILWRTEYEAWKIDYK